LLIFTVRIGLLSWRRWSASLQLAIHATLPLLFEFRPVASNAAKRPPVDLTVVRVKLGGVIDQRFSDGYFISAMLNPKSQMPCYTTRMTRNK